MTLVVFCVNEQLEGMDKRGILEFLSNLLDLKLESLKSDLQQHTAGLVDEAVHGRGIGGQSAPLQ